jgi:hypothetical protein
MNRSPFRVLLAATALVVLVAGCTADTAPAAPVVEAAPAPAPVAEAAPAPAPAPASAAALQQAFRDGRFGEHFQQALSVGAADEEHARLLALDPVAIADAQAQVLADRFDAAEADAIAAFYASAAGKALTAVQLGDEGAVLSAEQRAEVDGFFAGATGTKLNAVLADEASAKTVKAAIDALAAPAR